MTGKDMSKSEIQYRSDVDRTSCCAYGICAEICPEVYKLDPAGFAYAQEGVVPAQFIERAREAAEACPQLAITFTEV